MEPYHDANGLTIFCGDARDVLRGLPEQSVHCCVTSPPYWGLRAYLADDDPNKALELGLEPTPDLYVEHLVEVFRGVWRVLRDDGTVFLNLGDSYAANRSYPVDGTRQTSGSQPKYGTGVPPGLKPKDLCGIPWRVAFALQADGWYLRSDIIWSKPNSMPESVEDRPTKSHEYVFLLSKSERYFYDHIAVQEPSQSGPSDIRKMMEQKERIGGKTKLLDDPLQKASAATNIGRKRAVGSPGTRNRRTVWTISPGKYRGAHFATMPTALVDICVKAGTSERGVCPTCGAPYVREVERTTMKIQRSERTHPLGRTRSSGTMLEPPTAATTGWRPTCDCGGDPAPAVVLDPFFGSGTVGLVANRLGRRCIGIDLKPEYCDMAVGRNRQPSLLLAASE